MKKSIRILLAMLLCALLISSSFIFTACDDGDGDDSREEQEDDREDKDEDEDKDGEEDKDGDDAPTAENNSNYATVVVMRNDVAAGERITTRDIEIVTLEKDSLPEGYLTDRIDAVGLLALEALTKGEVLLSTMIAEPEEDGEPDNDGGSPDSEVGAPEDILPPPDSNGESIDASTAKDIGYVVITDYAQPNTGEDVSEAIQRAINENPQKTIYFPDGEYILAKPIATSANPANAVSLSLSNFAILKASEDWDSEEAMVRLGGAEHYNNIHLPGSNYYFEGGCIDGSMVATGISIDSGRETSIRNVSIKRTQIGLHIKSGANSGSSDADIETVNIVGNAMPNSIGVLIDGYDNTLSNMRIAAVQTGVKIVGAGNFLRNIHPLYIYANELYIKDPEHYDGIEHIDYSQSVAFYEVSNNNWYDICYSDQFAVGFRIGNGSTSLFDSCFCFWYSNNGNTEIGFLSEGSFNAMIVNSRVTFRSGVSNTAFLKVGASGGNGVILYPVFNESSCADKSYQSYLDGKVR